MGIVVSVCADNGHQFSKPRQAHIDLLVGLGVLGDAHCGTTVQHRSRVAVDPTQPNLRQVHLLHSELFTQLEASGFAVGPGDLGENLTTSGIDLLALPTGTLLSLGHDAVLEVTGLRNPCGQINGFHDGLLKKLAYVDERGALKRLAGIMAIVRSGGRVKAGDEIHVTLPSPPHLPLDRV